MEGTAGAGGQYWEPYGLPWRWSDPPTLVPQTDGPDPFEQDVVRADDLLVLHLGFWNLQLNGDVGNRWLARLAGIGPAIVIAHFPTQHLGEEAYRDFNGEDFETPGDMARVVAARPSRLVFRVPDEKLPVAYQLAALLRVLSESPLEVVPAAKEAGAPAESDPAADCLREPAGDQTAIELPFRLVMSPPNTSRFRHSPTPRRLAGRTELWHSRLARPDATDATEAASEPQSARAVWTRSPEHGFSGNPGDLPPWGEESPWRMPLNDYDRAALVHLTSNFHYEGADWSPEPVVADRLYLSALGGWLDCSGAWPRPPNPVNLQAWRHRAAMARDAYAKVVYSGFLFPFGHRASLVKITERRFHPLERDDHAAFLRQRMQIVVRQPELHYRETGDTQKERRMPFERVVVKSLTTPSLLPAETFFAGTPPLGVTAAFWPGVPSPTGNVEFRFHLEGYDIEGQRTDFAMPLIFMSRDLGVGVSEWTDRLLEEFAGDPRARAETGGSPLAFAPSERPGDTSQTTRALTFGAVRQSASAEYDRPVFFPQLAHAEVTLPAVATLTGAARTTTVHISELFVTEGMGTGNNAGAIYLALGADPGSPQTEPLDFASQGDRSGGLAKPSFDITGVSRTLGAVAGDLNLLGTGKFEPEQYFRGALDAKIFGVFSLADIVKEGRALPPADLQSADNLDAPRLIASREGADQVAVRLQWNPKIQRFHPFVPAGERNLRLDVLSHLAVDGRTPPASSVCCRLTDFDLRLIGSDPLLILRFERLEFRAQSGSKPDIECVLHHENGVEFAGPLAFVQSLRDLIPLDGFSDPPALSVTPEGLDARYGLAVPDLAVGIFALQNLKLEAALSLPFVGRPLSFRFAFCERHEPFSLTVSAIGGGGFFAITVDPNGVQELEAALEFGACIALNFGVASGSVHVMGGIYFAIRADKAKLTGYLRIGGQVDVLGLISASIELNLSLEWELASGKVVGRATLTIAVDIAFFSTSVEISAERRFAGSAGDPLFAQMMAPYQDPWAPGGEDATIDPWAEYCAAYA